jgi:hypothetical protein
VPAWLAARSAPPAPALPGSILTDLAWLSVTDTAGWVPGSDTALVGVRLNAAPVTAGIYHGNLLVYADDPDLDSTLVPVTMKVPRMRHGDHDAGNLRATVTDEGAFGYWDVPQQEYYGSGFVYPRAGGANHLWHGSVWVGTSATHLSDESYDYDYECAPGGHLEMSGTDPQRSLARFRDTRAPHPLGVEVRQEALAWPAAIHDDFLIVHYRVKNLSGNPLDSVYVGLYLDWDIGDATKNEGRYDAAARAGYMFNRMQTDSTHAGIVLLNPVVPRSFHLIHHPTWIVPYGTLRDVDKFRFLSDGVKDSATWEKNDWSMVMSAGPFHLAAGDSVPVSFAIVAGTGRSALLANAAAACTLGTVDVPVTPPARFAVHLARPNPFTGTVAVPLDLPARVQVRATVYDVLGRRVRTLADRLFEAGPHALLWDGRDESGRAASPGVYFCRVEAGRDHAIRRVVRLR